MGRKHIAAYLSPSPVCGTTAHACERGRHTQASRVDNSKREGEERDCIHPSFPQRMEGAKMLLSSSLLSFFFGRFKKREGNENAAATTLLLPPPTLLVVLSLLLLLYHATCMPRDHSSPPFSAREEKKGRRAFSFLFSLFLPFPFEREATYLPPPTSGRNRHRCADCRPVGPPSVVARGRRRRRRRRETIDRPLFLLLLR